MWIELRTEGEGGREGGGQERGGQERGREGEREGGR